MYTLRIINQTLIGAEERKNVFVGTEYSVLMKVDRKNDKEILENKQWFNEFDVAFNKFHDGEEKIDDTIIGFVYANCHTYALRDYNVVYIVGSEGQTIERIYGQYNKH